MLERCSDYNFIVTSYFWSAFMLSKQTFLDIGYFKTNVPRQVKPRSLKTKLVAWQLDERYYDGDRAHGYGGFNYDGRWKEIIPRLIERYGLTSSSKVLATKTT